MFINLALDIITTTPCNKFIIYTDSLSVLIKLEIKKTHNRPFNNTSTKQNIPLL